MTLLAFERKLNFPSGPYVVIKQKREKGGMLSAVTFVHRQEMIEEEQRLEKERRRQEAEEEKRKEEEKRRLLEVTLLFI